MNMQLKERGIAPPPNRVLVVVNGVPVRGASIELTRPAQNYDRGASTVAFPWFGSDPDVLVLDGDGNEVYRAKQTATNYRISLRRSGREIHCIDAKA